MTEPILLLGITEIGQSEALKPCLTNSQHIHKLTITHHRHHFDGTLDINQVEYRICGICLLGKITLLLEVKGYILDKLNI